MLIMILVMVTVMVRVELMVTKESSITLPKVEDTTMDGRKVTSKFSQLAPNQLEEEQVQNIT